METYEEGVTRDFIDVFIQAIKKNDDPTFNLEQLIVVCMDLFLGGTDTTSNTLSWLFLYLALNPDVQDKMREEIELISPGADPSISDAPKYIGCIQFNSLN
jgi:cytochrome P450